MSVLVFAGAAQIVTPASRAKPQRGRRMGDVKVWKNASIAVDPKTGTILEVGTRVKLRGVQVVDAGGRIILPGFVDSHTHPVYGGSRVGEFIARAQGKSYMEILKQGGGILFTVKATRKASDAALRDRTAGVFHQMLLHGTTSLEAKTGYGLSAKEELRELKILRDAAKKSPLDVFPTFLGAHAVPPEYKKNPGRYVDLVCDEMIPAVAKSKLASFCDVFCEEGVFSVAESRRILEAARRHGIGLRLHADEFEPIGGTELGVELKALSADHLMGISDGGVRALAGSDTAAVLLPCTSFFLGKEKYAPARRLVDAGAVVALATDFNAGSNLCFSMQMAASLGILQMKLTPEEALTAATLHGAHALGIADRAGSLHPGKQADFVLYPGNDYRELFYRYGTNQAETIVKKGKVVR